MRPTGGPVSPLGLMQSTSAGAVTDEPDVDRAVTRVSHPQADCAAMFAQARNADTQRRRRCNNRRPMNENADFIAKLQQIEEHGQRARRAAGTQHAKTRAQHIAILARALRGRLEDRRRCAMPA